MNILPVSLILKKTNLVRVGRDLLESENIHNNESWKLSFLSRTYVREDLKTKADSFTN